MVSSKTSRHLSVHDKLTHILHKILWKHRLHKREEGFSIVLVLWFLVLLGLLGANLLREARATYYAVSTDIVRLQAQAAADGAINFVVQNLLDPLGSTPHSLSGEFTNIRLLDRDVAIKVEDEAGKIDVNTANFPLLSTVIQGVGVPPREADFISENVVAWRSPQNTTMMDDLDKPYLEAGRSYGPRRGPFRAIPELRLVLGMTDAIQAAVVPFTTIWSDHADIDRGAASDTILGLLATVGDSLAVSEIQKRKSSSNVGTSSRPVLNHTFSIIARVTSTNVVVERRAVVRFVSRKRKPYVVLDWS